MAERPTLVDPPIENLLGKVGDSKFTLVAVTAIRAREINEYYNGLVRVTERLSRPGVIALDKSLSLAMEELYEGKLQFHRPTVDELENERLQAEALEQARQDANSDLDAFTDASATPKSSTPRIVLGVAGVLPLTSQSSSCVCCATSAITWLQFDSRCHTLRRHGHVLCAGERARAHFSVR